MKKIVVISLEHHRETTLQKLQDIGVLHIQPVENPLSNSAEFFAEKIKKIKRALAILDNCKTDEAPASTSQKVSPDDLVNSIIALEDKKNNLTEQLRQLYIQIENLKIWGNFRPEQFLELKEKGIFVKLYFCAEDEIPELPENCVFHEIAREKNKIAFAVVSKNDFELPIQEVILPDISPADLAEKAEDIKRQIENIQLKISSFVSASEDIQKYLQKAEEDFDRAFAGDQLQKNGKLIYIQGFVPENDMQKIYDAIKQNGWGLYESDADPDDPNTPVKLKVPKLFKIAKVILDFLGILPAYNENDVSVCVLFFLTLFFGMIVGDAGYGTLFLIAAVLAKIKIKKQEAKLPINLFIVLSIFTIFWGWINGNFFAIPKSVLPEFMHGSNWISGNDKHIQQICFFIAAIHLSFARTWRAWLTGKRLKALGHIGWGMIIWGNYFTAMELIVEKGYFPQFAYYLYGVGVVLVLAFGVDWKNMGEVLNLPFGFIGSFVDVLSYIRLFAVGLSSYYIAASFNNMGKMVYDISPWWIPGVILIIFVGHSLNILLAFMGVLVHGIRLNTLEFSNHMILTWSGKLYNPLRRKSNLLTNKIK